METQAVTPEERSKAAQAHLSVLLLGLLLPWTFRLRRSDSPFVAHHGRQATWLNGGFLLMVFTHVGLHFSILGVQTLHDYVAKDPDAKNLAWVLPLLSKISMINMGALILETLLCIGLALYMSRQANQGLWSEYFFLKQTKKVKESDGSEEGESRANGSTDDTDSHRHTDSSLL